MNKTNYEERFKKIVLEMGQEAALEYLFTHMPFAVKKKVVMCHDYQRIGNGATAMRHKCSESYVCRACKEFLNE